MTQICMSVCISSYIFTIPFVTSLLSCLEEAHVTFDREHLILDKMEKLD